MMSTMSTMSAIHAISSNSNSPTDPLRHNFKANGYPQTTNKFTMSYSPLVLSNSTSVNNNNNHINSDNSNTGNNTSGLLHRKCYLFSIQKLEKTDKISFYKTTCLYFVSRRSLKFEIK